ncbi:glycosyltransferase family 4 protein [uncultured Psychroserpens sp.]|uniref:glycosyltransferase family 4 protein n=1 Tax=uncultured Psychroserpens sp. TaxID=255436 RepID=UPI00261225EB|nr:glycosyltransferase family 4 protein [uncultured Psychroserpens sp.]
MNRKLKIAVYSGEIPSTTFIERLIKGIAKTGSAVYLFGAKKKSIAYTDNISVVAYKHNKFSKLFTLIKYSVLLFLFRNNDKKKLDQIIASTSNNLVYSKVKFYPVLWVKPDVFHLQWAKALREWSWVRQFGIKLVLSLRGAHINYSPIANHDLAEMYNTYFPKVDGFHAVSNAIAKEALKYGAELSKIQTVYSGLDINNFSEIKKTKQPVFNIVSVGRSHWVKGYSYAIDACKILKDSGLEFKYTVVGVSKNIELVHHVHDLKLTHNISLVDKQPFEQIKQLIANADVFLLPSLKEGVANVVLEAMALRTIVISTDCGGMSELIDNERNGYLIPIRNAVQMAEKLMVISNLDSQNKNKITDQAYRTINEKFTSDQMIAGMIDLYNSVLKDT